jgi:hypothetical protein
MRKALVGESTMNYIIAHAIAKALGECFSSELPKQDKETRAVLAVCFVIAALITLLIV